MKKLGGYRTLGKRFIESANRLVTHIKKYRRFKPRGAVVKINLGCGLSVAPGWVNIDASPNALFAKWPTPFLRLLYRGSGAKKWYTEQQYLSTLKSHVFLHHDLQYGVPFDDESVDYVYSSHWIEHLFLDHAEQLLREVLRVLKPGGAIRICVPDLEIALSEYQRGEKERALNYFFSTSYAGRFGRHQYLYDYELLEKLLRRVGFGEVRRCSYRQGHVPDVDKLDNRPEETLYVEASKLLDKS